MPTEINQNQVDTRILCFVALLMCALFSGGCGNKSDLYLPSEDTTEPMEKEAIEKATVKVKEQT